MNNFHKFITIGELSKLSGVNAKSLRYYEKIGILTPAYKNPENDYRYYAYSQINMVFAIQFYVRMGIPLEELHHFIEQETNLINFRKQISYGINVAKQQVVEMERLISTAEVLCEEIDRCDSILDSDSPVECILPEKHGLCVSFQGEPDQTMYYFLLRSLLLDIKRAGIPSGYETGIIFRKEGESTYAYVFADIMPTTFDLRSDSRYFYIPERTYLCREAHFTDLKRDKCANTLFNQGIPDIAIFSELFASNFDYRTPQFELRWSTNSSVK